MRTPPLALLLTLALAPVLADAQVVVADPGQVIGVGPDVTPGYYPTWQSSQPPIGYYRSDRSSSGRYAATGWPTGQTTMEYPGEVPPGQAPTISPYLLRNEVTPGGEPTYGHVADNYLSPLCPQTAVWYSQDGRSSTTVNWNAGLYLHQDVDIQYAQIQAGPLFIDFTSIEADALYSEISGPLSQRLPSDGFIAAIGLYFNVDLRLSPRTFFTMSGAAFYVPTSNRVGLFLTGGSSPYAQFEHSFEIGRWDVTLFDYLDVVTPISYLMQYGSSAAYDRSGLYTLGFLRPGFEHPFDSDQFYLRNTVGIRGSTFLGPDLRFSTGYEHYDTWGGSGFEHLDLDHYYAGLFYEPKDLWLMPWATFDSYWYDGYSSSLEQFFVGATMPFSPTLQGYARVGYAWRDGRLGKGIEDGSLVWDIGLSHQITREWSESAVVGSSYRISPLLQTTSGLYASYQISYSPQDSRFFASAGVTWAHDEPGGANAWLATATLGYKIAERTSASFLVMYSPADWEGGDANRTIWLYRAELDHNFTSTLSLRLIYQYTDYDTTQLGSSYQDHMLMLSLTKSL